jgi:hypothetical protein
LDERYKDMYNQITIGLVDALMQSSNVNPQFSEPKNFYNRFYRKDPAHITDAATWDAIPQDNDDKVDWRSPDAERFDEQHNQDLGEKEKLNPMFRFSDDLTVPYLHCELEGYFVQLLIDNAIRSMVVILILYGLAPPGVLAGLIFLILKFLIDFLTGNDGDADEADIDWDDPDGPKHKDGLAFSGDVVAVYGNWIMDTAHGQYFEIHPVRAYYIVAQPGPGSPVLVSGNDDQPVVGDNFDPSDLTEETANEICERISFAETPDPPETTEQSIGAILAYGTTTQYPGGGAAVPK